jgi:hypothetical protein
MDIVALLNNLTSSDPVIRRNAENTYDVLKNDANSFPFTLLIVVANETIEKSIRQLATVLLRRILIEEKQSVFFLMNIDL